MAARFLLQLMSSSEQGTAVGGLRGYLPSLRLLPPLARTPKDAHPAQSSPLSALPGISHLVGWWAMGVGKALHAPISLHAESQVCFYLDFIGSI